MANLDEALNLASIKTFKLTSNELRRNVFQGKELSCNTKNILTSYFLLSIVPVSFDSFTNLTTRTLKCLTDKVGVSFEFTDDETIIIPEPEGRPVKLLDVYCFMVQPFIKLKLPDNNTGAPVQWRLYYWNGASWVLDVSEFQAVGETEIDITLENSNPVPGEIVKYRVMTSTGQYGYDFEVLIPNCLTEE